MDLLLVDGCNFTVGNRNREKNHKRIIMESSLNYLSRQILISEFRGFESIVFGDCGFRPTHETFVDVKGRFVKIIYCSREEGGADNHIVNLIREKQKSERKKYQQIVVVTDDEMLKANVIMVIDGSIDIIISSCQEFERQLKNKQAVA